MHQFGLESGHERDVVGTAESVVFIRSNTLASTSQESIDLYADDIDLCADITGNIVSANMLFEDDGSGSLRVEQFSAATGGPLSSLNTFIGSTVVEANGDGNDVIPVAEGACGTP